MWCAAFKFTACRGITGGMWTTPGFSKITFSHLCILASLGLAFGSCIQDWHITIRVVLHLLSVAIWVAVGKPFAGLSQQCLAFGQALSLCSLVVALPGNSWRPLPLQHITSMPSFYTASGHQEVHGHHDHTEWHQPQEHCWLFAGEELIQQEKLCSKICQFRCKCIGCCFLRFW